MPMIYNHTSSYSTDTAFGLTCLMRTDAHLQEKLARQCIYSLHTGIAINETPFMMSNINKLHLNSELLLWANYF